MKNYLSYKATITVALVAASLWGCNKEPNIAPTTSSQLTARPSNQDVGANYFFDWETALKMPKSSLPGAPDVFLPWQSQGGTPVDAAIAGDYKKADGWELVYNTFMPDNFPTTGNLGTVATVTQQPAGGLYFTLYNRYRGLLRFYFYTPPATFTNSTQYSHGLQVYTTGNTTKALNFEGRDIVDVNQNATQFLQTSKTGIAYDGGWYVTQYEIAYDPTLAGTTYPNPGFSWKIWTTNITNIKSDGLETSTIKGSITKADPPSGFDWFGVTSGVLDIVSSVVGALDPAKGLTKGINAAIQSGTSGSAKDFLSGIFGQTSSGNRTVDLTLSGTIETTGTATSTVPFKDNAFAFPAQIGGTDGRAPLYSKPLGVFNLGQKPTVTRHYMIKRSPIRGGDNDYSYGFNLNGQSVLNSIQFNSNIFNSNPDGATVEGLSVALVVLNPGTAWGSSETRETIGSGYGYSSGINSSYTVDLGYYGPSMYGGAPGIPVVRVSFWVKPNNGAPRTLIVKSFAANLQVI